MESISRKPRTRFLQLVAAQITSAGKPGGTPPATLARLKQAYG
jgi:hypothetical protein